MNLLHVKSYRHVFVAILIFFLGFVLMYALAGPVAAKPVPAPAPDSPTAEVPATPDVPAASMPNYYVKLTRPLSSDETVLKLELPAQLKTSTEYLHEETTTAIIQNEEDIAAILRLLDNASRLPDDTKVISTSASHPVTLTLAYGDGFGNLYVFSGYPNNAKKPVTVIQDNMNRLYQTKADAARTLFDLVKPAFKTLNAEKVNIYNTKHFRKNSLQAQLTQEEDCQPILDMLNSLEKQGSSLDLDAPDYLITVVSKNSSQEEDRWFIWTDEKQVLMAFADEQDTVYEAQNLTSRQLKAMIRKHKTK